MDGLGRQRLAGSGFAEDEGDGFGAGGLGGFLAQAAHGGAVSDEPGVHFGFEVLQARFVGEGFHLQIGELALERLQFGHVAEAMTRHTLPFSSKMGVLVFRQRLPLE